MDTTSHGDGRSRFGARPEWAVYGGMVFPAHYLARPRAGLGILAYLGVVHAGIIAASWLWG